jgi:hypothetical protein
MCYVDVQNAPRAVWSAFRAGAYEHYSPKDHAWLFRGQRLRMGAYGDPVAVPYSVWSPIVPLFDRHTGYTHSWRIGRFWRFRRWVMASVESERDALQAIERGWHTFRVRAAGARLMSREIGCPAAKENGELTTCHDCGLCGGTSKQAKNVSIVGHGSPSRLATLVPYLSVLDGSRQSYFVSV